MRLVIRIVVSLVTTAVALLIAAALVDGFSVDVVAFPVVVVVYSAIRMIAGPVATSAVVKNAAILASLVGLVAAWATLLITDLLLDGLTIEGTPAWVLGPVVVWLGGVVADLLLGRWLLRRLAHGPHGRA